jgi:hypothetical protein
VTQGGRFASYGFYRLKGKPVFLFNFFNLERTRWEGSEALTPGKDTLEFDFKKDTLEFDFKYDGLGAGTLAFNNVSGIGRGGTGVLKVDGKEVATQRMEHTVPLVMQWGRELRHRRRHRHARGRRRLPGAFRVHRKARQADTHDRPAAALAGGHCQAEGGAARQQIERIARRAAGLALAQMWL